MEIAVVGSGGWGTAIAMLLHENRHEVTLISYSREESDNLARKLENPFLPGVRLPDDLRYTADPTAVSKLVEAQSAAKTAEISAKSQRETANIKAASEASIAAKQAESATASADCPNGECYAK